MIHINHLKISGFLLVLLHLLFLSLLSCGKEKTEPKTAIAERVKNKIRFTDDGNLVLTDEEVRCFLDAIPTIRDLLEKQGVELKDGNSSIFSVLQTSKKNPEDIKEIAQKLQSYGFDIGGFVLTYSKIIRTYNYTMGLQVNKSSKSDIRKMKDLVEKPYIDKKQKESMKKLIKEMEAEKTKVYRKNMLIIKKYTDELNAVFH